LKECDLVTRFDALGFAFQTCFAVAGCFNLAVAKAPVEAYPESTAFPIAATIDVQATEIVGCTPGRRKEYIGIR
jgi:hypothetical protein